RVVYGAMEPKAGACGSVVDLRAPVGYNHALTVTGGVRGPECAKVMQDFFRALRRKKDA
ncbi:MAG: tRNA-specific adenosine deaminase, partial [Planctomycetes bacterium]|nr:tRNA-specific adenosine deaminase [Planctomycetota bacterium]